MSSQVIDGWKPIRGVPGKTIVTQNSDGSYTVTIDPSAIGDGSGDMLKAVYDIDGNGIVDAAESVPWAGITDVPSTFTPSSHDHDDRYYTETEIGTILTGYSVTTHDHDLDYSALSHDHDDRYYTESEIGTILGGYVAKSLYDANSIVYATDNDTPTALTVGASTIVGRGAAGGIAALSASDARTVLGLGTMATEAAASYVANSLLTTRGDIIVRNATVPERLALTVPSSPTINFLGVANGETQPTWKSASSAGAADAHIVATDASGYTSVVRLGVGGAPTVPLDITGASIFTHSGFPVTKHKRTSTTTNAQRGCLEVLHTTSGDMVDGFGVGFNFYIEDATSGEKSIASIYGIRDGDDGSGSLSFQVGLGGSDEILRIYANGSATFKNGLIVNESGLNGSTGDFRAESDTEANMLWLDASADLLYLGGSTNGVSIAKGGGVTFLGTAGTASRILATNASKAVEFLPYSSNPGAAASVLATDASGFTRILGLGINSAVTGSNLLQAVGFGTGAYLSLADSAIDGTIGFLCMSNGTPTGTGLAGGEGPSNIIGFNGGASKYNYAGNLLGRISWQGQANDLAYLGGRIDCYVETGGNIARADAEAYLALFTKRTGSASPTEALRISASGNVGINKTAPNSKLAVVGLTDYANNAAAVAAGLSAGDFYTETGTNPKRVCVVY